MKLWISTFSLIHSVWSLFVVVEQHQIDHFADVGKMVAVQPATARKPCVTQHAVRVDVIVVNRHRQVREWWEINNRGFAVTKREFHETWWVSFWEWMPLFPPPAGILVDRGWKSMDDVRNITQCTFGWSVENKSRSMIVIIASELWFVDSPYDWEVDRRTLYLPVGR